MQCTDYYVMYPVYPQSATIAIRIDHFPIGERSQYSPLKDSVASFILCVVSFLVTYITHKNVPFSRLHYCYNAKFILGNVNWKVCHQVNKNWFLLIQFQFLGRAFI